MLLTPEIVFAHGGGELQITSEPVGPHLVSVWTNPPRARAGEVIHVTVGVAEQEDQSFVLDAEVLVEVFIEGEEEPVLSTTATTDRSTNKLFYETDFTLPDAALYTVVVTVLNKDGGGEVDFNMPVGAASNRWFGLIGVAALGGVGVLIALSRRKQDEETAVPRKKSRRPV
ncbi:MAG: hypothetical protein AAF614_29070 [Chloroflexota bacterium]